VSQPPGKQYQSNRLPWRYLEDHPPADKDKQKRRANKTVVSD